ncbi:Hypothetical protein Nlim_1897 [Candidatus Nitrosarchaeum limnium SFB1]|uniref:Uncharacterized protein n=1 Tax=Candidatus Nitrosarchaeum limnium SFB1 TaxID=886738 RepID=F3KNB6_9ARCH|nr:Hypothetical protein Nlim_1897 [Candidatus Nitrosarchaeum limnium SFB1]
MLRKVPTIGVIVYFGSICAIYTFLLLSKSTRSVFTKDYKIK